MPLPSRTGTRTARNAAIHKEQSRIALCLRATVVLQSVGQWHGTDVNQAHLTDHCAAFILGNPQAIIRAPSSDGPHPQPPTELHHLRPELPGLRSLLRVMDATASPALDWQIMHEVVGLPLRLSPPVLTFLLSSHIGSAIFDRRFCADVRTVQ